MNLLDVFHKHKPVALSSGQIRMQCPFREKHSGKYAVTSGLGEQSFFSTPNKNVYHCFSCGSAGKLTSLLTINFEVSYFDAVELVNVIPVPIVKKEFELDFTWDLVPPKEFLSRGFSKELLQRHKVGYTKEGYIAIPLYTNKVLKAVKFRKEDGDRSFWYSDSFVKVEFLYNLDVARSIKVGYTILTEGESDCWRLEEYGYDTTSLLGTFLSDYNANTICQIPKIYLALDADSAGIQGMEKIYHKIKNLTDVEFINYPAKDPADCSYRQFKKAFDNPCNYAEFSLLTQPYE